MLVGGKMKFRLLASQVMSRLAPCSLCCWRKVPDLGSEWVFPYNDINDIIIRSLILAGAPGTIRTSDPQIRSLRFSFSSFLTTGGTGLRPHTEQCMASARDNCFALPDPAGAEATAGLCWWQQMLFTA